MKTFDDGTPVPMLYLWKGQNIEDLTREELLDVVRECFAEIERERNNHRQTVEMWGTMTEARKAIKWPS